MIKHPPPVFDFSEGMQTGLKNYFLDNSKTGCAVCSRGSESKRYDPMFTNVKVLVGDCPFLWKIDRRLRIISKNMNTRDDADSAPGAHKNRRRMLYIDFQHYSLSFASFNK